VIRVAPKPEPPDFDEKVRRRGLRFLAGCPKPTPRQWSTHSYWRAMLRSLHTAYDGVCSYSCHWIPYDTGADTVEHFRPKSKYPKDAYEWQNYRLVCQLLNSRKGEDMDILDPFTIVNGTLVIAFPALVVKPAPGLNRKMYERAKKTCDLLGLNDEGTCLMMRQQFVTDFCLEEISFAHLEKRAPFLAIQMKEQGYDRVDRMQKVMRICPETV
jgi:hypothetical protein